MRLRDSSSRRGVVLIAVLIVVVLLSLAAYKYNDLMTAEYRATDSTFRAAQARANATSGVNYVAALVATNLDDAAGGNPWDNATLFQNIAVGAGDKNPRLFSIVSIAGPDDAVPTSQGYRFGLCDEAGKINVNALLLFAQSGKTSGGGKGGSGGTGAATSTTSTTATGEPGQLLLMQLPNMTEDIANAILDWIDPTDPMRTNGAKDSYYSGLTPPYRCKNGPLDSLEEMLLIKGVTPQLLFGTDKNRNGVADPDEDGSGTVDLGWSAYLTVHSREANFSSAGQPRIWVNDQTLDNLSNSLPTAVDPTLASFIIAARLYGVSSLPMGGTPPAAPAQSDLDAATAQIATDQASGMKKLQDIKSLWSLVNATVSVKTGTGSTQKTVSLPSPLNDTNQQRDLLPKLFDACNVTQQLDLTPRININTASTTVINALGAALQIGDTDMQAITNTRPSPTDSSIDPVFKSPGWLLTEANVTMKSIKLLDPFITTRSQVYRFQSVGYSEKGGPVSRVDAIVDANQGRPRIVFWRDLSELGKGFDIPAAGK